MSDIVFFRVRGLCYECVVKVPKWNVSKSAVGLERNATARPKARQVHIYMPPCSHLHAKPTEFA